MSRARIPLVLFCAEDDEESLARFLVQAATVGIHPELLLLPEGPGLAALLAERPAGLFVVCQGPGLSARQARHVRRAFRQLARPGQRLAAIRIVPGRELAMLRALESRLDDLLWSETTARPPRSRLESVLELLRPRPTWPLDRLEPRRRKGES